MADRVSSLRDEQINRNAEWAETFKSGATGSQRRRYADDIAEATQRHKQRQDQEFESLQLQNPEVGRLVIAREKENRDARNQILQRDLNERKFRWQTEKDTIAQEINQLRQEREIATEKRLLGQALLDEKNQLRKESQTAAVQDYVQGMIDKGEMPGSAKFAYGAAEALRQNPFVDPGYRSLLVGDAKILQDPDEAAARLARGETVTETVDKDGNPRFTFTSKPPKEESNTDAYREREYATRERDKILKGIPDPKDPKYEENRRQAQEFDQRAKAADAKIRGQGGAPNATAPPPAKPNNFTTAEDFKNAFQSAAPGTVLMYNGKPYKKP